MNSKTLWTLVLASIFLGACGSTATVTDSWVAKDIGEREGNGVLVVAIAGKADSRRRFEEDFAAALKKHGIKAVASHAYHGGTEIKKEDVVRIGQEVDVDAVLVTVFAGRDSTEVLNPGRRYYAYRPVYGGDYYGRGRVYGVPYEVGRTPDLWAQHNSLHLEANLYEIATEKHLWRASAGMEEKQGTDVATMRAAFIQSFMKDLADRGLVD